MSNTQFNIYNGEPLTLAVANDRGLAFGDGVFETIAVKNTSLPLWQYHLERLIFACQQLNISLNLETLTGCLEQVFSFIKKHTIAHGRLKIIVTRAATGPGSYPAAAAQQSNVAVQFAASHEPLTVDPAAVQLISADVPLVPVPGLAGLKHLNRLNYIVACLKLQREENQEVLFCDDEGAIIETMHHNIFVVAGEKVVTPALIRCGVHGVMRRLMMEKILPDLNIACEERDIAMSDLQSFDEIFLTNAFQGIVPVATLQDYQFSSEKMSKQLQLALNQWLERK